MQSLELSNENRRVAVNSLPGPATVHLVAELAGDANQDNIVDHLDLAILGSAYGSLRAESGFDPRGDINGDGIVDFRDLAISGANYGNTP